MSMLIRARLLEKFQNFVIHMTAPLTGITVFGHYRISDHIGTGTFGQIYRGVDTDTLEEIAFKVESKRSVSPQLLYESKIYRNLIGGYGIPTIHWYGTTPTHNILIIDLLSKSLEDLLRAYGRKFSLKTVLMLADQMISLMEYIHNKNYIFRDVKPDNFMMGVNKQSNKLFLIDYGLMKNYRDPRTHVHIGYSENKSLTGTARYASLNALRGVEQSRRDDMEALGFVFVYLLRGNLPWIGLKHGDKKCTEIADCKARTSFEDLCDGIPVEFVQYFYLIRQLRFSDRPNYSEYRKLFRDLFIREEFVFDYHYDWTNDYPEFSIVKPNKEIYEISHSTTARKGDLSAILSSDKFPMPVAPPTEASKVSLPKKPKQPQSRLARLAVTPRRTRGFSQKTVY